MSDLRSAGPRMLAERFWPSLARHGVLLVLIVAAAQILNPVGGRLLAITMIYAIAAVGLNITLGYSGLVSLAQASFIGLGAYSWTILSQTTGMGFIPAMLLAVALCAAIGFLVGALATRIKTHYFIIITLGVQVVFITLVNQLDDLTGGARGMPVATTVSLFGLNVVGLRSLLILIAVVFVVALFLANRLHKSRDGLAMIAIFESGQGAEAAGMNARLYRSLGMAIGSGFGGLAGTLFAPYLQYLGPESFSLELSILLLVMVAVGGLGSNAGVVVSVAVLTVVNHYTQSALGLSSLLYGVILILAVLLAPRGLAGLGEQLAGTLRRRVPVGSGDRIGRGSPSPERNIS